PAVWCNAGSGPTPESAPASACSRSPAKRSPGSTLVQPGAPTPTRLPSKPPGGRSPQPYTTQNDAGGQRSCASSSNPLVSLDGVIGSPDRWSPFVEESRALAKEEL